MKIPLDFFLNIIKKFLNEVELNDVSKVLNKHIEIIEEEYVSLSFRSKILYSNLNRMSYLAT
jgi:hypothetical protein